MGEQVAEPAGVTVWMVNRETGPDGWRGTLSIEDDGIVFRPSDGGRPREFAFEQIRRARRVRASPVLEVRLRPAAGMRLVGFYFIQPPNLEPSADVGKIMRKRRARAAAVGTLHRWNAVKKEEISEFARRLEERRAGAGGT